MICDDVCYLVDEDPRAHGIFAGRTEETTQCFCRVESVSRAEYWRAKAAGLEPSYVLTLSEYADYAGQKIVIFRGRRWRVLRTYVTEHAIELEIGEITADAVPVAPPTPTPVTEVSS